MKIDTNRINSAKSAGLKLMGSTTLLVIFGAMWISIGGCQQNSYPDPPLTLVDDSVSRTVKVAADGGWIPCPGECLKLSQPGWEHKDVKGFPPSDIWMTYRFKDNRGDFWQAYSQHHIGHIIRAYPDKAAEDVGICPVCKGTGWVRKDDANAKK